MSGVHIVGRQPHVEAKCSPAAQKSPLLSRRSGATPTRWQFRLPQPWRSRGCRCAPACISDCWVSGSGNSRNGLVTRVVSALGPKCCSPFTAARLGDGPANSDPAIRQLLEPPSDLRDPLIVPQPMVPRPNNADHGPCATPLAKTPGGG